MEKQPLSLIGDGYSLSITPEAELLKATLIATSGNVIAIDKDDDLEVARAARASLVKFRTDLEKSRKAVKDPITAAGRKIDDAALKFGEDTSREEQRINRLITSYAEKVESERLAKIEEARKAAAETARLEAEAAQRLKDFQDLQAQSASKELTFEEEVANEEAAAKAQEDAKRATAQAQEAASSVVSAFIGFSGGGGVRLEKKLDYRVTDLQSFAASHPQLVKIEIKRAETLALLKSMKEQNLPTRLSGLEVFEAVSGK